MTVSPIDSTAVISSAASSTRVRLGAHVSGGGLKGIPGKAVEIGCEGVQIFASSPQMWRPPSIKPADAEAFRTACVAAGLGPIAVHAIYLVNPCAEADEHRAKTVTSLVATLKAAESLGASVVVTHLGSAKGCPSLRRSTAPAAPSPRFWSSTPGLSACSSRPAPEPATRWAARSTSWAA